MTQYASMAGEEVQESVKIAVLLSSSPKLIREYLMVNVGVRDTYEKMKTAISQFLVARESYKPIVSDNDNSME
eukprot:7147698-Alexandrium_andersonii.AAC.1